MKIRKTRMRTFFLDPTAIVITVLGLCLMAVSIHYNVNPVCAGAVRDAHPVLLWVLVITTVPAMFVGLLIPDTLVLGASTYVISVYACQALLYFALGKALSVLMGLLRGTRRRSNPSQPSDGTR